MTNRTFGGTFKRMSNKAFRIVFYWLLSQCLGIVGGLDDILNASFVLRSYSLVIRIQICTTTTRLCRIRIFTIGRKLQNLIQSLTPINWLIKSYLKRQNITKDHTLITIQLRLLNQLTNSSFSGGIEVFRLFLCQIQIWDFKRK